MSFAAFVLYVMYAISDSLMYPLVLLKPVKHDDLDIKMANHYKHPQILAGRILKWQIL